VNGRVKKKKTQPPNHTQTKAVTRTLSRARFAV
jgi:hypothetical protein